MDQQRKDKENRMRTRLTRVVTPVVLCGAGVMIGAAWTSERALDGARSALASGAPAPAPIVTGIAGFGPAREPVVLAASLGAVTTARSWQDQMQTTAARFDEPGIAERLVDGGMIEKWLPALYNRFDREEGDFDRAALVRELDSRITATVDMPRLTVWVRVTGETEQEALELTRLVAERFDDDQLEGHTRSYNRSRARLDSQMRAIRGDIESMEAQRENLIRSDSITALDVKDSGLAVELSLIMKELVGTRVTLARLRAREKAAAADGAERPAPSPEIEELMTVERELMERAEAVEKAIAQRTRQTLRLDSVNAELDAARARLETFQRALDANDDLMASGPNLRLVEKPRLAP